MRKTKTYKTIDLFAGIGGIRKGFEKAGGFETVFANDFDAYCKPTYDLNFPRVKLNTSSIEDLKKSDIPDYDILLGGFPCQPFSVAGYRRGFEDEGRGNMFAEIVRLIKIRGKRPTALMLENVKNLRGHDHGKTYRIIKESLEDLGYKVKAEILNTMEHGNVPQNRERIFIVAFQSQKACENFKFPGKTKLTKKLKDILDDDVSDEFYYNGRPLHKKIKEHVTKTDTVYQWRRVYVRENKKGVCPTLTANMGMGGHNVPIIKDKRGVRKLTPRECARLQGFPESFKLPNELAVSRLYKQFGNSVSVTVIARVARAMKKALDA